MPADRVIVFAKVFSARLLIVSLGYCSLEAYLARQAVLTACLAMVCAIAEVRVGRRVIGQSDNAAFAGSVVGIGLANLVMTSLRRLYQ